MRATLVAQSVKNIYIYIYIHHIFFLFNLFTVSGHLGCLEVLAIVNSAAMNIGVRVSFWIMVFYGYVPRSLAHFLLLVITLSMSYTSPCCVALYSDFGGSFLLGVQGFGFSRCDTTLRITTAGETARNRLPQGVCK